MFGNLQYFAIDAALTKVHRKKLFCVSFLGLAASLHHSPVQLALRMYDVFLNALAFQCS